MTDGRYTPDDARAAPKIAPAPTVDNILVMVAGENSMILDEGFGFAMVFVFLVL